jgi:hypothetical protein
LYSYLQSEEWLSLDLDVIDMIPVLFPVDFSVDCHVVKKNIYIIEINNFCLKYFQLGQQEVHIRFWLENLMGRNHLGDMGRDGRIILRLILWESCVRVWAEFIWLGTWSSGRL